MCIYHLPCLYFSDWYSVCSVILYVYIYSLSNKRKTKLEILLHAQHNFKSSRREFIRQIRLHEESRTRYVKCSGSSQKGVDISTGGESRILRVSWLWGSLKWGNLPYLYLLNGFPLTCCKKIFSFQKNTFSSFKKKQNNTKKWREWLSLSEKSGKVPESLLCWNWVSLYQKEWCHQTRVCKGTEEWHQQWGLCAIHWARCVWKQSRKLTRNEDGELKNMALHATEVLCLC